MAEKRWNGGRAATDWAILHAKKNGMSITKTTCIKMLQKYNLGVKIGGRWCVDKFRWESHIASGITYDD